MGEKTLVVDSRLTDAIQLIKKLDSMQANPTLAVWYFYDDAGEWRLLVAGPFFDALLQKQEPVAYRKIVDAMAEIPLSSLTVSDIKLVPSESALANAIRRLVKTSGDATVNAHFSDTTLNGIFIKEMVVLRSS